MARDPETRPSRRGWPTRTGQTTTSAGTHDHELPQGIFRLLIGLAVFLVVLALTVAVLVLYIVGRGNLRERQIEQTRHEVREQLCQILDGLPQGGVLDLTRDQLGCGPGMPLSAYPPEIRRQLSPPAERPAEPPASPATEAPDAAPEQPPAATSAPAMPPAPDGPVPLPGGVEDGTPAPTEPPPLSPPSQVRELVCDLLPVCEES